MNDSLYRPPVKQPKDTSYAVRMVIPDDWGTIPKDLKPLYDELWMAMRPVREFNMQITADAFAAACLKAGLWPGWPTVEMHMDDLCRHWCRYCAMVEDRQ